MGLFTLRYLETSFPEEWKEFLKFDPRIFILNEVDIMQRLYLYFYSKEIFFETDFEVYTLKKYDHDCLAVIRYKNHSLWCRSSAGVMGYNFECHMFFTAFRLLRHKKTGLDLLPEKIEKSHYPSNGQPF